MNYFTLYNHMEQLNKDWKFRVDVKIKKELSDYLSRNQKKNLVIGNMVYGVANGRISYCYLSDYNKGNKTFYPIWDKECCGEYGWYDFGECCRIYDTIKQYIKTK